jgi:hypothetical protein
MSQITSVERRFSDASLDIIEKANAICSAYKQQGYDLTLRQLYYQFVSRDWIANRDTEYKRLGSVINDARLAGELDWDYIVDRTRYLDGPGTRFMPHWENPAEIIEATANSYRLNKWADQDNYVEVWIEKDALKGVLEACCPDLDVAFFSCRGYASQSEIWSAARRLGAKIEEGKNAVVVHLGDHDPSGSDKTRDIEHRLAMFIAQDVMGAPPGRAQDLKEEIQSYLVDVEGRLIVERIALNMNQIDRYNPPPNPAKLTDARAAGYIATHGRSSWELDALDPDTLVELVRGAVDSYRDEELYDHQVKREDTERETLTTTSKRWDDVREFLEAS